MTNTTNNNQHSPTELTELDASEFGNHVRQGGWRLGLLVARNVEKGKGNGGDRRSDQFPNRETETGGKVNALTFAEMSGVGKNRVLRYLAAWNLAAEQGIVPMSWSLTPGEDIDIDVDSLPAWSQFYEAKNTTTQPPAPIAPSVEQVTEAVRSNPEYAKAVSEYVEPTREQVTKAMRTNPEIEKAAREEAWDITREKALATTSTPPVDPDDQPAKPKTLTDERADIAKFWISMRKAERALNEALGHAQQFESSLVSGDVSMTVRTRAICDAIDDALRAGSFDDQLATLLAEEGTNE